MNVQKLLRQAQEMQQKMEKEQAELQVEAAVGGGMVRVTMDGHKNLIAVKIDPEVVDPEDVGLLEDLLVTAFNEASRKMDESLREKFGSMVGNMPKLF
jgi:DNA-binding YbaB/EbfC family protein